MSFWSSLEGFMSNAEPDPFDWDMALAPILPVHWLSPITDKDELAEYILAPDHHVENITNIADPVLVSHYLICVYVKHDGSVDASTGLTDCVYSIPEVKFAADFLGYTHPDNDDVTWVWLLTIIDKAAELAKRTPLG